MARDDKANVGHRHTTSDVRGGRFPEGMLPSTIIPSIEAAQAEAASKSKVVFSANAASGTDFSDGDIWYQRVTGIIIAQWEFVSGAWASRTLDGAVVANLDASKITTGTLAAGQKITAGDPAGSRVELDSAGLRKYATDGTTVQVDLTGEVAAFSGLITGSEIIGGELRTASSGARIEMGPVGPVGGGGGEIALYSGQAHESLPAALYAFSVGSNDRFTKIQSAEFSQEAGAADELASLQLDNAYSPDPASQAVSSHAWLGARQVYLQARVPTDTYYNNPLMGTVALIAENRITYSANAEEYLSGSADHLARRIVVVASAAAKAAFVVSHQSGMETKTAFLHPISPAKPLFVWQVDAAAGQQLQSTTDGTTWTVIGGGSGGPLFADPGADRLVFWDDAAGAFAPLVPGVGFAPIGTGWLDIMSASEIVAGIVELATSAEAVTGLSATRAVTTGLARSWVISSGV